DCSVPFVVVHALGHAEPASGRAFAMVAVPHARACEQFVGAASRLEPSTHPAHPSLAPLGDRAFADRVPFALGSALREYGNVSGRRHDVLEKAPLGEAPLVMIGMGALGEALLHATAELRARGYDVGAVHVTALRPFPGARLVKAIARALAVTVLEPADEPLASGGVLAREVKSAFTDAITWAPGFPGIGRIPKLFHGVTGHAFDVASLAAICENMLADERGKRSFSLVEREHTLPTAPVAGVSIGPVAMRWVLEDRAVAEAALAAAASVLATALGLRTHGIVATATSGSVTLDIVASREHARGGMARRGPRLVLGTERTALGPEATGALGAGAVLGVLATDLPDAVRAAAREHRARIVPLAPTAAGLDAVDAVSAACVGAAVAVAARGHKIAVDPTHLARAVSEHFATRGLLHPDLAADRARQAFDATNEALLAGDLI
ncbi:MAG TPA: hypothetical protein VIF62_29025, partial [Labilithrix sp.]